MCLFDTPFYTYVQSTYPFLGLLVCCWGHGSCLWPDSSTCVCILQGPVAVKRTIKKDESIRELFGGLVSSLTDKLLAHQYGGDIFPRFPLSTSWAILLRRLPLSLPASKLRRLRPKSLSRLVRKYLKLLPGWKHWLVLSWLGSVHSWPQPPLSKEILTSMR